MELQFIELGKLTVSKTNMRYAKKAPDVSDILPTVRKRGVIVPILVRPNCADGAYEVVAGARRFTAASIVAEERRAEGQEVDLMPCAILDDGDDADAIETSLIENVARLDPDEVTQWVTFTRLVKEGKDISDIAATFGLPELGVRRVLALGNLMPRIRTLYADGDIDAATVRHLTMASKSQQRDWLALYDDPDKHVPLGYQAKSWLLGGQLIAVRYALFDPEGMKGVVADLFGEERYFSDGDAFWTAQNEVIAARRAAYLAAGWSDVVIVPPHERFASWEYEKTAKRKGGRVYVEARPSGEVIFHEGYMTRKEARRIEKGEAIGTGQRASRPEVSSAMQTYIALHRHAAVRAALIGHNGIALRVMVAQAVAGSPLWTIRVEPQSSRNDAVRESIENAPAEARFDEQRRAVLALLGFDPDTPTVTHGDTGIHGATRLFLRLLDLPDNAVMDVLTIVVGETLDAESALVDALGTELGVDMAPVWQADDAFFALIRDKEVLRAIMAEVAGGTIANANANEKGKTMTSIIRAHLDGSEGRAKVENWVPRWLAFPPAHYTPRGGVGSVAAHNEVEEARNDNQPEPPDTPASAAIEPMPLAA